MSLAGKELSDVNLVLFEAGLEEVRSRDWYGDDRWEPTQDQRVNEVLQRLRALPRPDLESLATALEGVYGEAAPSLPERQADPILLFASHLSTQKVLVGQVGEELATWGVRLFVAHDSIEPDLEWQSEIERALSRCHAGVAFLMPEFGKSAWCDQEVGWLQGRGVPCLPLKFQGQDPYGFLGKKQAHVVHDVMTAAQVASAILEWLAGKPQLRQNWYASLVEALKTSRSFRRTDVVWERLYAAEGLSAAQVAGLLTAIRDNDQVYNASGGVGPETAAYKELVFRLVLRQPGFEANVELAREVAAARGLDDLLDDAGHSSATSGGVWDEPPF